MLQMKLAGSTIEAGDDLEKMWYGNHITGVSRSFIASRALSEVYPFRNSIDWEKVNQYSKEKYDGKRGGLQTALDFTDDEVEELTTMQSEFQDVFKTKMVYKPFVVKMLFMAELFYKGMGTFENERKQRDFQKSNVLFRIGTLNVQGFGRSLADSEWETIEKSIARNDLMALQELVPEESCKWIKRCEQIKGTPYMVITPVAWNEWQTKSTIAVTLIRADLIKNYEPITIEDDKETLSARYTYGVVTLKDNLKFRLLNVYMPQLYAADTNRVGVAEKFWKSLLDEIDRIPPEEKVVLIGDLNAGKDKTFLNSENFHKLCKKMTMLDADEKYDTWFSGETSKRLDYIFVSGNTATEYTLITNRNSDALDEKATDHVMLEATFIKQDPYKEYCKRMLEKKEVVGS